jgi:hypothetical protein
MISKLRKTKIVVKGNPSKEKGVDFESGKNNEASNLVWKLHVTYLSFRSQMLTAASEPRSRRLRV